MTEVPDEVKIVIVPENLRQWRATLYDAEIKAKVAKVLGNQGLEKQQAERMEKALRALDALEEILRELPQETEPPC